MTPKQTIKLLKEACQRATDTAATQLLNHTAEVLGHMLKTDALEGCTVLFSCAFSGWFRVYNADGSYYAAPYPRALRALDDAWHDLNDICPYSRLPKAWLLADANGVRHYTKLSSIPKKYRYDAS